MKGMKRSAVTMTAAAGAVSMLLSSAPLFAAPQQRGDYRDRGDDRGYQTSRDERVENRGRVRSFNRERDGYRVYLEGDNRPYWVPSSRLDRGLSVGLDISFGGIFRGGVVNVDAVTWPDHRGYNNYDRNYGNASELRGVVERVDYRDHTIWLRNRGQVTRVDVNRRDLRSVRRGDRISLEGRWTRGGDFEAYRIF